MKISKGDIVLDKEDNDGLLFVATNIRDGWFESIAVVCDDKIVHRKLSFDGVEVVGNVAPKNFHMYNIAS